MRRNVEDSIIGVVVGLVSMAGFAGFVAGLAYTVSMIVR